MKMSILFEIANKNPKLNQANGCCNFFTGTALPGNLNNRLFMFVNIRNEWINQVEKKPGRVS